MTNFVLHTGMTKTASSTLQNAVLSKHSEIGYIGKTPRNGVAKGCLDTRVFYAIRPLLWDHSEAFDADTVAATLRQAVGESAQQPELLLGSWEALSGQAPARYTETLERLRRLGFRLRILVAMRNPLSWLSSQYLQEVQGHFVRANRDPEFKRRPYLPLRKWVAQKGKLNRGYQNYFCHAANIRASIEMLGAENVDVLLFEDLKKDADAYYRQIASALDINPEETLRLARGAFNNPRLTEEQLAHVRHTGATPWRRLAWRRQPETVRRKTLNRIAADAGRDTPARQELTPALAELVAEYTRSDNAWLQDTLGLDLSEHGYPV